MKINEKEFYIKKGEFDIKFRFTNVNFWRLEEINIKKQSTKQEINVYPSLNQKKWHYMLIEDSYGACRKTTRYYLTGQKNDFFENTSKTGTLQIKENIYEDNQVIIDSAKEKLPLIHLSYDINEKCFILDTVGHNRRKVSTPKSIIFNIELSNILFEMYHKASDNFKSKIRNIKKPISEDMDIKLDDINVDLRDLSSWFEKEKEEFKGYEYLMNNVTAKDIAKAAMERNITGSNISEAAKPLNELRAKAEDLEVDMDVAVELKNMLIESEVLSRDGGISWSTKSAINNLLRDKQEFQQGE